ncbi:hypothetical protein LW979_17535, partial [Erwinia amylovora]|uniref:hypothetical protein n=1 Tax=Erwinia amylovora TaxID=552 RepID=UPI0020BE799B
RNSTLERRVFAGLRDELLSPERLSTVVKVYHAERARLERESGKATHNANRQIAALDVKISRLVNAIAIAGENIPELVTALQDARAMRDE